MTHQAAPDRLAIWGQGPLYGLVAWPPTELHQWLRQVQNALGVSGFGEPHLSLRAPFITTLDRPALIAEVRRVLVGQGVFEVQLIGWQLVGTTLFLECAFDVAFQAVHARALQVPVPQSPHDGAGFRPHLTLGLCILPTAADQLWAEVQAYMPPVTRFTVNSVSLTAECRGEVQEIHTLPLSEE